MISAMTITDARKQAVDFIPYFVAGESFVVAKNSALNLTKLSDLCGHKVAAESGTAELDEANGLNDAGKACASKKLDRQGIPGRHRSPGAAEEGRRRRPLHRLARWRATR